MHIDGLDELDNKILAVIEKNARISYSEIGQEVGLSRVSVKNRMDLMEKKGIIEGYFTKINATSFAEGRRFFLDIVTEPGQFAAVVNRIAESDVIRKVYAVTGECRIKAEGFASSNTKYETFMKNLKNNLEGVRGITIQDVQFVIKDVDGGVEYGKDISGN